jgi:AcrR family transcriptional regulator
MPKLVDFDERRSELAEAAAHLIARAGIGAATMRDVAAEAGWTTGALTHYFTDKRDLLLCTFQASLEGRRAARAAGDPTDPLTQLTTSLEGALPLDDDRRRHWMVTIAFCAQATGDSDLATAQRDAYREFRARVADLVGRCGFARGAGAETLAERLIAAADGIAVQALFDPELWPAAHQLAILRAAVAPLLTTPSNRLTSAT